jgi:hypothetical protein
MNGDVGPHSLGFFTLKVTRFGATLRSLTIWKADN